MREIKGMECGQNIKVINYKCSGILCVVVRDTGRTLKRAVGFSEDVGRYYLKYKWGIKQEHVGVKGNIKRVDNGNAKCTMITNV